MQYQLELPSGDNVKQLQLHQHYKRKIWVASVWDWLQIWVSNVPIDFEKLEIENDDKILRMESSLNSILEETILSIIH